MALRGLRNYPAVVEIAHHDLAAEIQVVADRRHDARQQAGDRQPEQAVRQHFLHQQAVGKFAVVAVARSSGQISGAATHGSETSKTNVNIVTAVTTYIVTASRGVRVERIRCPSTAPPIGAASPP